MTGKLLVVDIHKAASTSGRQLEGPKRGGSDPVAFREWLIRAEKRQRTSSSPSVPSPYGPAAAPGATGEKADVETWVDADHPSDASTAYAPALAEAASDHVSPSQGSSGEAGHSLSPATSQKGAATAGAWTGHVALPPGVPDLSAAGGGTGSKPDATSAGGASEDVAGTLDGGTASKQPRPENPASRPTTATSAPQATEEPAQPTHAARRFLSAARIRRQPAMGSDGAPLGFAGASPRATGVGRANAARSALMGGLTEAVFSDGDPGTTGARGAHSAPDASGELAWLRDRIAPPGPSADSLGVGRLWVETDRTMVLGQASPNASLDGSTRLGLGDASQPLPSTGEPSEGIGSGLGERSSAGTLNSAALAPEESQTNDALLSGQHLGTRPGASDPFGETGVGTGGIGEQASAEASSSSQADPTVARDATRSEKPAPASVDERVQEGEPPQSWSRGERAGSPGAARADQPSPPPLADAPVEGVDGRASHVSALDARRFEALSRGGLEQIVRHVEGEIDGENASLKMQLAPGRLGDMELKIELERGLLTARFVAASEEVKAMIESALPDLKRHLADQGVLVQELSVSVGERHGQQTGGGREGGRRSAVELSRSKGTGTASGYEAVGTRHSPVVSETVVDLVV